MAKDNFKPVDPRKKIKGKYVGTFNYTWNAAKKASVTLKQIAVLRWGKSAIREYPSRGRYSIKYRKYKLLVRAATKYPRDNLKIVIRKIHSAMSYKDIHPKDPIY